MLKITTVDDLMSLVSDQVEEGLHLDYKAADALGKTDGKKKEISKDVSALANSDGGIIIYGIKEYTDPAKKHLPESIDSVDRTVISKEWLEQVINSNISPRIDGISILPVPVDSTTNGVVYIVTVEKSNTAHQAADLRYYRRFNFESQPMYDYEIRDIMNRNKFPEIELSFVIDQETYVSQLVYPPTYSNPLGEKKVTYTTYNTLHVYGHNNGGVYANYVNCILEVPASILDDEEYNHLEKYIKDGVEFKSIYCDNTIRELKDVKLGVPGMISNQHNYWPSRYDPILPGTNGRLKRISLKNNIELNEGIVLWSVYADNAEQRRGQRNISDIEKIKKAVEHG